jgi:hypothetical protein
MPVIKRSLARTGSPATNREMHRPSTDSLEGFFISGPLQLFFNNLEGARHGESH